MDPNANLKEQLEISKRIIKASEKGKFSGTADTERLAELVVALDEWIVGGGFLPKQWRTK
jgi:hypothetical protein